MYNNINIIKILINKIIYISNKIYDQEKELFLLAETPFLDIK